jgi:hypothetical protein
MEISEFNGIQAYHDGRPASDYLNMIPMGQSVIDRLGEIAKLTLTDQYVLETFVDSLNNIYIATTQFLYLVRYEEVGDTYELHPTTLMPFDTTPERVTFCESSTKPSQVYMCDGRRVFYWNTTEYFNIAYVPDGYKYRVRAFVPVQLPLFDGPDALKQPAFDTLYDVAIWDPAMANPKTATRYYYFPEVTDANYDMSHLIAVSAITWFDNRLVLVQSSKNTVWLSSVDPSRWILPSFNDGIAAYPRYPWQFTLNANGKQIVINDFISAWYASTASSANLIDAVTFAGQLYFLNDTSIEVWSATGNADNPIQHNSQNTIYYGGRSPVIVNDKLYLICKGALHNDFIAEIGMNGQINHVSNDEIEQRLGAHPFWIRPLTVRDQSMIVVYTDETCQNGYALTKQGYWWHYTRPTKRIAIDWTILNRNGHFLGISRYGVVLEATETSRTYSDGSPILRDIRGAFLQFTSRKILREVEVICDTGIYYDASDTRGQMFLHVSFDRGLNFGPYLYRKFGAPGKNDRVMLWRNCGSGNSIMLEFGTSDNVKLQIYGIRFELT